jgi:hypothetical protein
MKTKTNLNPILKPRQKLNLKIIESSICMWKCITIMSILTTSDIKMEGLKKKGKAKKKPLT